VATLRQDEIQQATGLYSLLRNLGASVGISLMIAMQGRAAQTHQSTLAAHLTPYDAAYRQTFTRIAGSMHGLGAQAAAGTAFGVIYGQLIKQATLLSYMDAFRWMALICISCCPLAWLLRKGQAHAGHIALE
jgi:DHA2 family multidrug resistance protein